MDLITRDSYPIVRPSRVNVVGNHTYAEGGMNVFHKKEFTEIDDLRYILDRTGEEFHLFDELKKCCLFSVDGVCFAFSNVQVSLEVELRIGRIVEVDFESFVPKSFSGRELTLVAHPIPRGIAGDVSKHEFIFPHFQFTGAKKVNITASAFDRCPINFKSKNVFSFYLGVYSEDRAVQLLQKSILEFSQNNPNFSIVYLYSAIEAASANLSAGEDRRISSRLHGFAKEISHSYPEDSKILKKLKKKIENTVVHARSEFAHKGNDLTQKDLLPSYQVALEFFWYYTDFRRIKGAYKVSED